MAIATVTFDDVKAAAARIAGGEFVGRLPGQLGGGAVDLLDVVLERVVLERDRGGVEGVGLDEIGPGLEEGAVDAGDQLGLGQAEQVAAAAQVHGVAGKTLAAEIRLLQVVGLDHGAHGAVEEQDAFGEQGAQLLSGWGRFHI